MSDAQGVPAGGSGLSADKRTPWGSETELHQGVPGPSLSIPSLCFTAVIRETAETKTSPSYACNLPQWCKPLLGDLPQRNSPVTLPLL